MKILCISDLHLSSSDILKFGLIPNAITHLKNIKDTVIETNPDLVVCTGDTVWSRKVQQISPILRDIIPYEIPIVVTLGNHEFWNYKFERTLERARVASTYYGLGGKNIFYLDVIGSVIIGGINFVGGTLFFDGSMRYRENQHVDEWDGWQDFRIPEIQTRYLEFNQYYKDMIEANIKSNMPNALCTHHVPHSILNGHEPSHYSFYTGMKDFVHELPFNPRYDNYIICGHTHKRVIGEVIPWFMCVNVGSDYNDFKYYVLET